ncbi:MAG: putative ABC transport system permease protein [Planctomycetota bacterium]|jgi:putative ABC transport system permease protein
MWTVLRVGFLLGWRQIQRANKWITVLIIFIMMLTFLFLVVISGILVGLIVGGNRANRAQYTGDVIVTTYAGESSIERSQSIISTLETIPQIESYTTRYIEPATVEANYRTRRDFDTLADTAATQLAGIVIANEEATTHLSNYVVEGEFLNPSEDGYILLGANLLRRYSAGFGDAFDSLEDVFPGDRVRVHLGDVTKEFIVKGVIDSKVGEVSIRAFLPERELIRLAGRNDLNVNEIAIIHDNTISDDYLKTLLVKSDFDQYGKIQTADEAIPQFLLDIKVTFGILGNVFGAVGLIVAVITIFIIVFINAITRRKYIGILKAIGVKRSVIEIAYMIQAFFYAIVGSGLGLLITYGLLVPGFEAKPLDFPFSDGILVAPFEGTMIRLGILLAVTIVAGFIPAWLIGKKNTLDSILGR